jgi:hypothetical protein
MEESFSFHSSWNLHFLIYIIEQSKEERGREEAGRISLFSAEKELVEREKEIRGKNKSRDEGERNE